MSSDQRVRFETLPQGFLWDAVKAGIKASGKVDLAAAVPVKGARAAAMFTMNQVVAAPVTVGRRHLAATDGRVGAVLVNAGNANCATGQPGIDACVQTCAAAAESFGCIFDELFPSSTGIIGVPFPGEKVIAAMPALKDALGDTAAHAEMFARAIMTTDTKMKVARAAVDVPVFELGVRAAQFDEAAAHAVMLEREYTITLDMGLGKAECRFLTCDLTEEYVRINADYST
ncbi:MAG: bifunctional ornithine acetyltransferase/N-acetylglutamate synthase [Edaphobacter sp.]